MNPEFNRRDLIRAGFALTAAAGVVPLLVPASAEAATRPRADGSRPGPLASGPTPWSAANTIVAATAQPAFPSATFPVTSYGAKGDGKMDDTAAFAKAVNACHSAGGGHVTVPSGTYSTGAIYLKSNVDLHLESGSTLMFNGTEANYPNVLTRYEGIECMNHSPMIYAHGESNIGLTGSGTLDASGTKSWNTGSDRAYLETLVAQGVPASQRIVPGSGHHMRSTFVEPYSCDKVLIQGVKLRNSQFWQMHPTLSTNVTVDGVNTAATNSNTDGCDPECCDHVVIRNCTIGAGDDTIAIKSGRDADGRRINTPSQNIVIYDNTFTGPWGAVTCGSELTGGISNVYAYHCTATVRYAFYVKSNTQRGGYVHNANLDSINGTNLTGAYGFVQMNYNGQTGSYNPSFKQFAIANCTCDGAPQAFNVQGLSGDDVSGFTVTDAAFTDVKKTSDTFDHVSGLKFSGVTINGKSVSK